MQTTVEIGNVKVTGPLAEVAKFLSGHVRTPRAKLAKANGKPKKKRKYTKRSDFWKKAKAA